MKTKHIGSVTFKILVSVVIYTLLFQSSIFYNWLALIYIRECYIFQVLN